jgi:phage protein D/phage baseplate assembly protein gpV
MPAVNELASQIGIKIDGNDVQSDVMDKLASAAIDQHTFLPGMFTLRFYDSDLSLMDSGPFNLTKEVEISAAGADNEWVTLIKGEITALEPEFGDNMIPEFVVRGYDPTHRLYRETRSKAYLNVKDSDIAQEIAGRIGLSTEIETTRTVYDHVFQSNQSDLAFLMERAWRIGFECFVEDGKLYFRKPPNSSSAPITLKWGEDLKTFYPRMTLAEQVDEVIVRGWDPKEKKEIIGKAESGNLYPDIEESKDGKTWASDFGSGKKIIVDEPVISQSEADVLASARLDEVSGAFVDAEGTATRRPDIKAGQKVKLENLGTRFSGEYLVTHVTHTYSPEGFSTDFQVTGSRLGLLSEQLSPDQHKPIWPGVVLGVVTNSDDPDSLGRVKVKFPWLGDDTESFWARVVGIGAGPNCGLFVVPAVGDEVLVAFEHGNINRPYVIGGTWNSKDTPPPDGASASSGEQPKVRVFQSIGGHIIALYDNSENKVEVITKDGRSITLSDKDSKVIIKNSNVVITLEESNMKLEAMSNLSIEANSQIKLKASAGIEIDGGSQVNIKGAIINLN